MEAALDLTEAPPCNSLRRKNPEFLNKFWLGGDTLGIVPDLRVSKQHDCFNTHASEIAATCASNFNILVFECGHKPVFKHEDTDFN